VLARNLKYLRKKSGKSQEELARIFEINRSTWSGYENGKPGMPVSLLKKVSGYFEVSADYLLDADLDAPLFRSSSNIVYDKDEADTYSFVLQKLNALEQKLNQLLTQSISP
jgi:transcriptional regulator with XRE-family HTH domain